MVLVFSQGEWRRISMPEGLDPLWNSSDKYYYAATFCRASSILDVNRAAIVAEAIVNRRLYPGIQYSADLERSITLISREQHEAP
jgi:hypothetical protein